MILRGQFAREHEMPVEDGPRGVGHGVIHIIALHQYIKQAGDGAVLVVACAFEQLRQQ